MRLLLAEDELSLSKALCAILRKNNYSVDAVYDGAEATDFIKSENYDAVILDIMMPKKSGIEVLKSIRKEGIGVPVIQLTAKSDLDDKVLGLDSGANDYLTKPFEVKELLARIRAVTRRYGAQSDVCLKVGNVSLNTSSFELSANGRSFKLANKEFQMMEMLMRNPKNLISTEHFMERIWGYDSEAEINVVWVYISYLRKKLAAIGADIGIKAQRNSGYCLEALK